MKAEIEDLGKKYYGTTVTIHSDGGIEQGCFQVWVMGDYEPSDREMVLARESLEMPEAAKEELKTEWLCDSHYETNLSYNIAKYIVDGINEGKVTQ